jgi:poly [ADP-ribose] polymerase
VAHQIEEAKTGRASCRSCKKPIAKGDLRLGEEVPNAFAAGEVTYQWHHLPCAAKKKPLVLEEALQGTALPIPDREALEKDIAANKKNQKPTTFPYAERAKTSRSTCISCSEAIEKGTLRIAVEREVDTGAFVTSGAGYLHAACATGWIADNAPLEGDLLTHLQKNSTGLEAGDVEALKLEVSA